MPSIHFLASEKRFDHCECGEKDSIVTYVTDHKLRLHKFAMLLDMGGAGLEDNWGEQVYRLSGSRSSIWVSYDD